MAGLARAGWLWRWLRGRPAVAAGLRDPCTGRGAPFAGRPVCRDGRRFMRCLGGCGSSSRGRRRPGCGRSRGGVPSHPSHRRFRWSGRDGSGRWDGSTRPRAATRPALSWADEVGTGGTGRPRWPLCRGWAVAGPGVGEVEPGEALALGAVGEADVGRADAVLGEQDAEPAGGEPGRAVLAPGRFGVVPQPVQQLFGRQRRGVAERAPAVGEQGRRGGDRAAVVVVLGGQQLGRGAGAVPARSRRRGRRPRPAVPRCRRPGPRPASAAWRRRAGRRAPAARSAARRPARSGPGRSRRCRNGSTCSPGPRRRIRTMTARSSMVSGMCPIPASAAIAKVGMRSTGAGVGVVADRRPVALVAGVEQAAQVLVRLGRLLADPKIVSASSTSSVGGSSVPIAR